MDTEERDVRIIGIEKSAIKESHDQKGIWILPFKLSVKPDDSWARNFFEVNRKNTNDAKRKANVVEDRIEVSVAEMDDQQKLLDAIKIDVADTNALCEENYQKKLSLQQGLEALKKKQNDVLEKLKEDSDKLQF